MDRPSSPGGESGGGRRPVRGRATPGVGELFRTALWLGAVGFGGGVSVLGMLESLTARRGWLTAREFDNTATVAQMLPGGAAANALAHVGLRFHGLRGAAAGYVGFILPGACVTLALAWAYVHFGVTPRAELVLGGLNAAVVGMISALALRMVKTSVARLWQMMIAVAALLLSVASDASSGEIAVLGIGAGLVLDLALKRARLARIRRVPREPSPPVALPDEGQPLERVSTSAAERGPRESDASASGADRDRPPRLQAIAPLGAAAAHAGAGVLLGLALLFLRTGLGAYGGGFAIIPHLHATAVDGGWVTERQFTDAVAVGKLTPGPVLIMATFIGYVAHGFSGALVATVTIFAAPFALVYQLGTWLARMRSRRAVRAALRGLTPAVVGLIAAAAVTLGKALDGSADVAIAAATALTLTRFRLSPILVLVIAGVARWALAALAGI